MSPERQRIAIAEACGWKYGDTNVTAYGATYPLKGWRGPTSEMFGHGQLPPDYLNDLNAMHEAEKVLLTGDRWHDRLERYSSKLMAVMEDSDPVSHVRFMNNRVGLRYYTLHATASERAEAFLRILGKWEETA